MVYHPNHILPSRMATISDLSCSTVCARKNGWISQANNVLKLHQIKHLLLPSNSHVNAVYLLNNRSTINKSITKQNKRSSSSLSRSQLVIPAAFLPESPRRLQLYQITECLTAPTFTGLWPSRRFFFNVDPVARTESTQLKIIFRLGTLARRLSWK